MSMYSDILKEKREAVKACPKCHKSQMKRYTCGDGKIVFFCMKCGHALTEEGGQNEKD